MKNIQNQNRSKFTRVNRGRGMPLQRNRRITPAGRRGIKPLKAVGSAVKATDMRNKIILNKRARMNDARERLSEIAKGRDAREKLNKIRRSKGVTKSGASGQKTLTEIVANALVTRKNLSSLGGTTQLKGSSLVRTVKGTQQKQSTFSGAITKQAVKPQRYQTLPSNPTVFTIKNDQMVKPAKKNPVAAFVPSGPLPGGPVRPRSAAQKMQPMKSASQVPQPLSEKIPQQEKEIRPTKLKITAANDNRPIRKYDEGSWSQPLPARQAEKRLASRADLDYTSMPKKPVNLSTGLISRLDQPHPRPLLPTPGYRVIISNLHSIVTLADIEELFGSIGPYRSVRLLRNGVAEVYFEYEEDAYRSVEVYHNRQLDRLPMDVRVMREAPLHPSGYPAAPYPRHQQHSAMPMSVLRSAGGSSRAMNIHNQPRMGTRQMVMPDVMTVHRALF